MDPKTDINPAPLPERCALQSPVFAAGAVRFCRAAADGTPVMALQLGDKEAQWPLASLTRVFSISEDSPDGRMLELIGSALDFVSELEPGDAFPAELRTGEASWEPAPAHLGRATARLRLNVAGWLTPGSRWNQAPRDDAALTRLADDRALRAAILALAPAAARRLHLPDASAVLGLVDSLAAELSYIEALRERLLLRATALNHRLAGLLRERRRTPCGFDALAQLQRLVQGACRQIESRFEDVDGQTGEAYSLLANAASQRRFIRCNRDWLYRSQREWTPMLDRWDALDDLADTAALVAESTRFLAPRWMAAQRWQSPRPDRTRPQAAARMTW